MKDDLAYDLNISCPCRNKTISKEDRMAIQCCGCGNYQHRSCIGKLVSMKIYLCPSCQIAKNDFYENTRNICLPSTLIQHGTNESEYSFVFNANCTSSTSVIMIRCLKLSNQGFKMQWPEYTRISINKKVIASLESCFTKKEKVAFSQPFIFYQYDNKVNALKKTHILSMKQYFKSPNNAQLVLYINHEKNISVSDYVISVDEVELLSSVDEIISNVISIDHGAYLKAFSIKNDALKMHEKVSFIDVYTGTERIKIPARGIHCLHLAVFDLKTFLLFSRSTQKYLCPFCNKDTHLVYIDNYIREIINRRQDAEYVDLDIDYNECDNEEEIEDINELLDCLKSNAINIGDISDSDKDVVEIINYDDMQMVNANASTYYDEK